MKVSLIVLILGVRSRHIWSRIFTRTRHVSIKKGKGKVFNGLEPPSGESTTTECGTVISGSGPAVEYGNMFFCRNSLLLEDFSVTICRFNM